MTDPASTPAAPSAQRSIQDTFFPDLPCFGCGPANADGLQLKSFPDGSTYVARFRPWPAHDNGMGSLNGGIIATVLDCHSAAAVVDHAHRSGWPPLPGAALPYVTAGLDVRYLRPSPLHAEVVLRAEVVDASEAAIDVLVWLAHEDKRRAEARAHWRRWRPR